MRQPAGLSLKCFFLALLLQVCSFFCKEWVSVSINLNTCVSCGRLIVRAGHLMQGMDSVNLVEESINSVPSNNIMRTVQKSNIHASLEAIDANERELLSAVGSRTEYVDDFRIDDYLHIKYNFWNAWICTAPGDKCVRDVSDDTMTDHDGWEEGQYSTYRQDIVRARLLLFASLVVSMVTAVLHAAVPRSESSPLVTTTGAILSATLTFAALATLTLPIARTDDATFAISCSIAFLTSSTCSAYLHMFVVYLAFRDCKQRTLHHTSSLLHGHNSLSVKFI